MRIDSYLVSMVFLIGMLSGCSSSISQQQAEGIAHGFIEQNVKFFTKGDNATSLVDEVNVPTATSYKEGDVWVVVVHVSSMVDGVEKKNDLIMKVDKEGRVTEFNGQKLE